MSAKPLDRLTWGRLPLVFFCCEMLPFTRTFFGRRYFWFLFFCFALRATLLMPFPTASAYANFQVAVSFAFAGQVGLRLRRMERLVIASQDAYYPGASMPLWFFAAGRSFLFLFVVEPLLAAVMMWFLAGYSPVLNSWTPPFYLYFMVGKPESYAVSYLPAITDLPAVLQTYTYYMRDLFFSDLADAEKRSVAEFLLLAFPVSLLMNNIAEFRAERARPPAPAVPKSNEPELTFPTVREQGKSAGGRMPSFRAMAEKLRRGKT